MEESDIREQSKLRKVYKNLKDSASLGGQQNYLLKKAQIFSIPILYQILLLFTILKLIIVLIYFIWFKHTFFNFNIALIILQLLISISLTKNHVIIKLKNTKFKKFLVSDYYIIRFLRLCYILLFFLEENSTIYYYERLSVEMSPAFIFFIMQLILFFDSTNFNDILFMMYIINLAFILYFFSLRNIMNFFFPINLVLVMFVLLRVISHKIGRKLAKSQMYYKFFEYLIEEIFKINKMFLTYEKRVLYPEIKDDNQNQKHHISSSYISKGSDSFSPDRSGRFSRTSIYEMIPQNDSMFIQIGDFKGFELAYSNPHIGTMMPPSTKNIIVAFINSLNFLKHNSQCANLNHIETEMKSSFESSKKNIKSKIIQEAFKNMAQSEIKVRNQIIVFIISILLDTFCWNNKLCPDEILGCVDTQRESLMISFNDKISEEIFSQILQVIQDLLKSVNITLKVEGKVLLITLDDKDKDDVMMNLAIDEFKYSSPQYFQENPLLSNH